VSSAPVVRIERHRGQAAAVLSGRGGKSGSLQAVFLPEMGMLGASLTFGGDDYLSLQGGVTAYSNHHTTGLPLLHPWANRLDARGYRVSGVDVSLDKAPYLHRDDRGLPIHGSMVGPRRWTVCKLTAGRRVATLHAAFDFGAHPDLLQSFPFPHVIELEIQVDGRALRVVTSIRPTGKRAVPISFGWHPYFRLPGVRRSDTVLSLPKRRHLALDGRSLPTGKSTAEPAEADPLGERDFDDAYRLTKHERVLGLAGDGHCLTLELDEGYPYAQIYAPASKPFVALEPMTAPTNALATGSCAEVKPGHRHTATFTVRIAHPITSETS
jgi:galactose mutarotase-like enzyme